MADLTLSLAPSGLLMLDAGAPDHTIEAYFYTFTKAQMVARDADPDPTTNIYYTAMTAELEKLGWTEIKAKPYAHRAGGDPVTPIEVFADAMFDFAQQALPFVPIDKVAIQRGISPMIAALKGASGQVRVDLDRWWNDTAFTVDLRIMTIGPLVEVLGMPWVSSGFFHLQIDATSWEALITPSNTFVLTVSPMVMTLDLATYAGYEAALKAELEVILKDHIRSTDLDLDTCTLGAVR